MSLLGILSKESMLVQTGAENGSGWGCIIRDAAKTWRVAAFRGGDGAAAVHIGLEEWTVCSSSRATRSRGEGQLRGHAVLTSLTSASTRPHVTQASRWAFAYEGTIEIEHSDALRAALDPAWTAEPPLRTPGDLVCTHVLVCLMRAGVHVTQEVALMGAARDLGRARKLGAAAFLCSDGQNLHAYSLGVPLTLASVADAVMIGTPEVIPQGAATRSLGSGALVSLTRMPKLGWSAAALRDS